MANDDLEAGDSDKDKVALTPDAIARSIAYAVEQPADVDVSEIIIRPVASDA